MDDLKEIRRLQREKFLKHKEEEKTLVEAIKKFIPKGVKTINSLKTCLYTYSPDKDFILDFYNNNEDIVIASGFSGHGFKFASVIGEILSELVIKGKSIHPINFCVARCFIGDGSDGLKGIPGAGFKAMAKRFPELKSSSFVSVEDILTLCRDRREQKRLKLYDSIISEEEVVKRNWKLMYLGNGNLSASHIKKIDDIVATRSPKRDKLGFMRCLIQLCIKNFDTDKLFMTFRALN